MLDLYELKVNSPCLIHSPPTTTKRKDEEDYGNVKLENKEEWRDFRLSIKIYVMLNKVHALFLST